MKVCVGAFLFHEGRVLLGLRSQERVSYPGVCDAIGGHVELQESIRAALVRELAEEIQVTPIEFVELATLSEIQPALNGDATYHIFLVTRWSGDPAMRGDEHSEIRWFSISEATNVTLAHPGYVDILRLIANSC